jgi:ribosome-associated toxin RatA of RatAB toxin-antitoxin module
MVQWGMVHLRLLGFGFSVLVALGASVAAPAAAWPMTPAQRAAVERGEIVVVAERRAARSDQPVAATLAALKVAATPDAVFAVLTDCAAAPAWMPHLVECRILETDATGTSELIAHRVHYGWFAPRIDYVFRVLLRDRRSITFENVSGDLAQNDGIWALETAADGTSTIVTYTVRTRPKFYVPQWLYRRAVRAELPGMLRALRQRAESTTPDSRRPAGA